MDKSMPYVCAPFFRAQKKIKRKPYWEGSATRYQTKDFKNEEKAR